MLHRHRRAILAVTSLLVLGVVLGIAFERVLFKPAVSAADEPLNAQADMVVSLRAELDLEPAQVSQIEAILARHQAAVTDAWQTIRPRLRVAMDTVRSEIEAVLTSEQRERFRVWLANQHGASDAMRTPVHRP